MRDRSDQHDGITRREALRDAGAAGLGLTAAGAGIDALLAEAAAAAPKSGSLADIEHVVIFMQENRSFDHLFGVLSGVRGFDDTTNRQAFTQPNLAGERFHPFHLGRQCYPDLTHDWAPQHISFNRGRNNRFIIAHEQADGGPGVQTMGYYTRADVPLHYALADAFTICDNYHCSVIGPTDPNRLMSMSATIDPAGNAGGPLIRTNAGGRSNAFSWTTMPESLEARGISWKVYTAAGGGVLNNMLTYFKQYTAGSRLAARGLAPVFPDDFIADLAHDRLPQVSWLLATLADTEHPGYSSAVAGEAVTRQIVEALVSHPKVWRKCALLITWDENGGFFDHVPPPVPPPGTKGEFLTVKPLPNDPKFRGVAGGFAGPIGLGFRVPALVVSPFSRGGLVYSGVLDHTSLLRFIERRFGARVPNLSKWRRRTTGDMTGAFNFAARPITTAPRLPKVSGIETACSAPENRTPVQYVKQSFPRQEPGRRGRPSGLVSARSSVRGRPGFTG
jgi:phospholipase C